MRTKLTSSLYAIFQLWEMITRYKPFLFLLVELSRWKTDFIQLSFFHSHFLFLSFPSISFLSSSPLPLRLSHPIPLILTSFSISPSFLPYLPIPLSLLHSPYLPLSSLSPCLSRRNIRARCTAYRRKICSSCEECTTPSTEWLSYTYPPSPWTLLPWASSQ